jgi:hypothetical protein
MNEWKDTNVAGIAGNGKAQNCQPGHYTSARFKRNKKETLCELCDSSAAGGEKKLKICHIEKRKKDGFLAETGKLRMA